MTNTETAAAWPLLGRRDLPTAKEWAAAEQEALRRYQQAIVASIREAVGEESLREFAERCGVGASALSEVLNGKRQPDVATVARIEINSGYPIWPRERLAEQEMRAARRAASGSRIRPRLRRPAPEHVPTQADAQ